MTFVSKLRASLLALPILVVVACSSTTNGGTTGGGTTGGGTCTPNNTDGASSCQGHSEPCPGGKYCSINICNSGCLSTANCPNGQVCDMSAASQDSFLDKPVGLCRACPTNPTPQPTATGTTPTPGACSDVHGVYTMSLDASSSKGCGTVSGECTVTQSGCKATLSCPSSTGGTNTVDLDANNKGSFKDAISDGQGNTINADCAVSFTSTSLLIDCQFTASGGAAICKARGAKK